MTQANIDTAEINLQQFTDAITQLKKPTTYLTLENFDQFVANNQQEKILEIIKKIPPTVSQLKLSNNCDLDIITYAKTQADLPLPPTTFSARLEKIKKKVYPIDKVL